MDALTREQAAKRERTLLTALLLSMWAPLTTGIAVILSQSTTQLADFIRRSVELLALFVSWRVFRYLQREKALSPEEKAGLERAAGLCVAVALGISGIIMLILALSRASTYQPGGNVYPGLAIAILGLLVNTGFWRRYTALNREQHNRIMETQGRLYLAKALVDLCVILALASVAFMPAHPATPFIDISGSAAVSLYLMWSGVATGRRALS